MAKPVSEEELQLKKRARRRLIGAIALVAAVAAVLPMVLDTEPKPTSRDINIQIPTPEAKVGFAPPKSAPAKSDARLAEAPAAGRAAAEKPAAAALDNPNDILLPPAQRGAKEKPVTAEKAEPKAPEKPPEKAPVQVAEKAPAKAAEKAAEKAAAPKAGPGAFFIQVMALSEPDKARQMQQKIIDAGVRAYTETAIVGAANVTRVRAGPFATREEADKALNKLQGIGFEGKVAAY